MIALTAARLARIVGGIVEGDDQTLLSGADVGLPAEGTMALQGRRYFLTGRECRERRSKI